MKIKEFLKQIKEKLKTIIINFLEDKKRVRIYLVATSIFLIDIITKTLIINAGSIMYRKEIIKEFFYLDYSTNTGGAFSILSNYTWLIVILSFIVLIYIDKKLIKKENSKLFNIALAFLIGGISGNLFDRILRGEVIDFISFYIFRYPFPIFNIADIFICLGAIYLIIDIIRGEINDHKSRK